MASSMTISRFSNILNGKIALENVRVMDEGGLVVGVRLLVYTGSTTKGY